MYRDIAIATAKNAQLASTTKLFVDHVTTEISAMANRRTGAPCNTLGSDHSLPILGLVFLPT